MAEHRPVCGEPFLGSIGIIAKCLVGSSVLLLIVQAENEGRANTTLVPEVSGTIRKLPELNIFGRAPVGDAIQSTYFKTTTSNREFRRGVFEFAVPKFATEIRSAELVLQESRGTSFFPPVPPRTHRLLYFPGDGEITVSDFDNEDANDFDTFNTDANETPMEFRFDATKIVEESQGGVLAFRVQLDIDLEQFDDIDSFGSGFGGPSTIPPMIEINLEAPELQAGDADQDLDFDQLDLIKVQQSAKYLSGNPATWGDGDWNGAPGGKVGMPPAGDGRFNQLDIIAALGTGNYLTGPYAAVINVSAHSGHGGTSIAYDATTGEVTVDTPAGIELTSINIDSATGIFTENSAANLGGSFDNHTDVNVFKATFGGSFGSTTFGSIAKTSLPKAFVINDLSVTGSLAGGGELDDVELIYVPEPSCLILLAFEAIVFSAYLHRCPSKSTS